MNGKPLTKLPIKRGKRCPHLHWSGRRCPTRIASNKDECVRHQDMGWNGDDRCAECKAMKLAFGLRVF